MLTTLPRTLIIGPGEMDPVPQAWHSKKGQQISSQHHLALQGRGDLSRISLAVPTSGGAGIC